MLYVIGKVRNKADGPVARNPHGKRLCGRADLSLVTRVEQPHRIPRFAQRIPQNALRGHEYY